MDWTDVWSGPAADPVANSDWLDTGASTPPPSAQPSFNSPATQDSFSVLNKISTGVSSVSDDVSSIFGSITGLKTSVQTTSISANATTQAAQLGAQQQQATQRVQLAQSSAQQHAAQTNANISSAFDALTASPLMVALLVAGIGYMLFFRKRA
jgi:hypothetical protein